MKFFFAFFLLVLVTSLPAQSEAQINFDLALKRSKEYKIDSARFYMKRVLQICKECSDRKLAKYYTVYANFLKNDLYIDSTFYYLVKAENIYKKYDKRDSLLYLNTLKAEMYRFIGDKETAKNTISKNDELIDSNTPIDILAYYYNRKMSLADKQDYRSIKKAKEFGQEIIDLEPKITDKSIVAYTLNELGFIYNSEKKSQQALQYYLKAYYYANKHNEIMAVIDISINLGRSYANLKDFDNAIFYLKRALNWAKKIDALRQMNRIYVILKRTYDKMEADALILQQYQDSINNSNRKLKYRLNLERFRDIEAKYNLNLKEKELIIEANKAVSAETNLRYTVIILLISLFGASALFYMYYRTNQYNKKLKLVSAENEFLLGEANHRINNNLQLIVALITDELSKEDVSGSNTNIKKLLTKVESISTLHKHLYKSNDKKTIEVSDYLKEIKVNFDALFKENDIIVDINVQSVKLPTDFTMYLGLLVTELFVNTIKHAFGHQTVKSIILNLSKANSTLSFNYSDNGTTAMNQYIEPKLVKKICKQLKVDPIIDTSQGFSLTFNKTITNL